MGWALSIRTDRRVAPDDVTQALNTMDVPFTRAPWGWSSLCDIYEPTDRGITVSGSYAMSGDLRIGFTRRLRNAIRKLGYAKP